ncbi:hypothetical protein [Xaviernesmea oryzae]|uniref:hypothetical protein n=1 Tax=Xaviernesmea oryzae TaxID=464029 RepID=UPI0011133E57|nr:hypothetical protein [Xaviernesmea oryzae]
MESIMYSYVTATAKSFRMRNAFSAIDVCAAPHDHKKHRCHRAGTLGGVFWSSKMIIAVGAIAVKTPVSER